MKNLIKILLVTSLVLTGCAQQTSSMFITSYVDSNGEHYVYDQDKRVYSLEQDYYKPTDMVNIPTEPAMCFIPMRESYSLSENFIGNYTCSVTDAFAYVTHLCDIGYVIDSYTYTPKLCSIHLSNDEFEYNLFIEEKTTRIYRWNSRSKEPCIPEDTTYENE